MARHFELVAKKGPVSDSNESQRVADGWVNISRLKKWASIHLAAAPYLRSLILSERDELSIEEFLLKADIWVKLLAEETNPIKTCVHMYREKSPEFYGDKV